MGFGAESDPEGSIPGVMAAIVTQNQDPEGLGRVRLRLDGSREGVETDWARVAAPMTRSARETFVLPEIGDEVLVAFAQGDVRFPYVLGALWSRFNRPPKVDDDGRNDISIGD